MPRPPTSAVTTRQRILDAAEDTFAHVGYEAASLSAIADLVGIRTPSLYKHFGSKQDLFDEAQSPVQLQRIFRIGVLVEHA